MVARPNRPVRVSPRALYRLPGLALALIFLPAVHSTHVEAGPPAIPWQTSYEQGLAAARETGRPLWLQFTGAWCGYCHKMEAETFPHPEVAALGNDAFVPIKVDAEHRPDLLAHFGIRGLPATILMSASGQVLGRHQGFADPYRFAALLQSSRPAPAGPPPDEVALAGFDPVSLVEGEGLVEGEPSLAVQFDGREFRFADPADREAFLAAPERYSPVVRGCCPVGLVDRRETISGDPRCGVYYEGHLYLCADDAARQRFAADPARYANVDLVDEGHCPHCRSVAGRLVPGKPEYSAVHHGRRYLFPDEQHRAAFRSSPETYIR